MLITGANRGLGKAISICLAERGYTLLLHGRSEKNFDDLLEYIPFPEKHIVICAYFAERNSV